MQIKTNKQNKMEKGKLYCQGTNPSQDFIGIFKGERGTGSLVFEGVCNTDSKIPYSKTEEKRDKLHIVKEGYYGFAKVPISGFFKLCELLQQINKTK